jgi:hypothetical protein
MDFQFYGANCISISHKSTRIVVDDNLSELGKTGVIKAGDVALYTTVVKKLKTEPKLVIDCVGEYEVSDISIIGISARAHTDEKGLQSVTMYKISAADLSVLVTGHIFPELNDEQREAIGITDVLIIPVGGHGYTMDGRGALNIIKELEPKMVIPTHYEQKGINYPVPQAPLEEALADLGMELRPAVAKLRLKPTDLSDITQLSILEVS